MCLGQRAKRKEQMPSLIDLCTARTRKEVCVYGPPGLLQSPKQVTSNKLMEGTAPGRHIPVYVLDTNASGYCVMVPSWFDFVLYSGF